MTIWISRIFDPAVNLAIESSLFSKLGPANRQLFLYVNNPCVVIGRNQNPWFEVNLARARSTGTKVIRRRSGGGTVVHDRGNVNFCVQFPRSEFSRDKHLYMLTDKLRDLSVNERNDIVNSRGEKVSGSSYRIDREKCYHHATMLLNSDLSDLRKLLSREGRKDQFRKMRGTESIPSPVANANVSEKEFYEACINGFQELYGHHEIREISDVPPEIEQDAQTLSSWSWTFGETPRFEHIIDNYDFLVDKGRIMDGPEGTVGSQYRRPLEGIPSGVLDIIDPQSKSGS